MVSRGDDSTREPRPGAVGVGQLAIAPSQHASLIRYFFFSNPGAGSEGFTRDGFSTGASGIVLPPAGSTSSSGSSTTCGDGSAGRDGFTRDGLVVDGRSDGASCAAVPSSLRLAAPVPAKVEAKATTPGPAYIAVEGTGLVRIDATGKVKTIIPHDSHFYDLAIDQRTGTVYASAIGGFWEIKGDSIGKLPQPDKHRNAEKMTVGPDGVLWSVDHGGVSRWDGKSWTREPAKTFEASLLGDIAVDQGGRVWLTTTDYIWRLEGDKWKRLDNKFAGKDKPFWKMVATGPSGEVYAVGMAGSFVSEGDAWRKVPLMSDYNHPDEIAVGANGTIAASGGIGNVVVAAPGAAGRPIDMKLAGIVAQQADAVVVDGSGRVWLKTDNGVVILDGEGKLLRQLAPGTVAGLNGKVQGIAVAGGGPELPEQTKAAKGTVVGKVIHRGKGLAGIAVEMCASPASFFTKTPCDSAPLKHRATTGADGSFSIPDVLVGAYGFTVKPKSKWLVFWGSSGCCQKIEDGQTYDAGSITLERLE